MADGRERDACRNGTRPFERRLHLPLPRVSTLRCSGLVYVALVKPMEGRDGGGWGGGAGTAGTKGTAACILPGGNSTTGGGVSRKSVTAWNVRTNLASMGSRGDRRAPELQFSACHRRSMRMLLLMGVSGRFTQK